MYIRTTVIMIKKENIQWRLVQRNVTVTEP
jgi:hypothetical protein